MIDQPSCEADTEHDIVRKQRMPLSSEAQKLALYPRMLSALVDVELCLVNIGAIAGCDFKQLCPELAELISEARAIK